jgi:hypothetical protein
MRKIMIENINQILAEWDPIGVGEIMATEEYRGYIRVILKPINNRQQLMNCLKDILINEIRIEYCSANEK